MNSKELKTSITVKIIAIISCIYGLIVTFYGPISYTYFTTLSNVFILIMLLIFLIKDIKHKDKRNILYLIKYLATISISLTFFVFLFILAPANPDGFIESYKLYHYGSLCLHFITPLLAIMDFFMFDYKYESKKIHSILATFPPLLYIIFVIILSSLGIRWHSMKAPYNFLNYGSKVGWFGINISEYGETSVGIGVFYMIIILLILFIILGILFLDTKDKIKRRKHGITKFERNK